MNFALLLFLWIAFGGPIPLKPEGYRVQVPFNEATQLAVESDVRISGVSVGKVKEIELDDAGSAVATLEIDSEFAPIPEDSQAILRQKTLLGETYVELTPGSPGNPAESGDELGAQGGTTDTSADGTDFIPVIGLLDDLVLLPLGIALVLRLVPPEAMADARARAEAVLALPRNLAAAAVIVLLWIGVIALLGYWAYRAFAAP